MKSKKMFSIGIVCLCTFVVWTLLVRIVDVAAIGPCVSSVGFSSLNQFVHELTGANMTLYTITDWLGLVPIFVALGFAILGLVQWIKRKSFLAVDRSIFLLGAFYIAVMMVYIFFEFVIINYRPILIDSNLEASYPSSTTMLVMCVMPTALMQLDGRIKNVALKRFVFVFVTAFIAFMVIGRLISGVHWISDIIGGVLVSIGFVSIYYALTQEK